MSSRLGRLLVALSAASSLLVSVAFAQAQGVDEFGGYGYNHGDRAESPQDTAFELRVGRYRPEVDSQFNNGQTPFGDVFGSSNRFELGAEIDWQVLRVPHFGTLSPGLGWGLTKFSNKAQFTNGSGTSGEDTRLWIMPMYLVAVARADVLPRDFKIPFVPYAKVGLGVGMWWSSDGQKGATADNGVKGKGLSYGLTYALGAMFLLDVLDADDAKSADGLTGINNSYIFAEWFRPQLDGFGSNKVLDISSSSWVLGIALEM
jgi:hypothetical protein